MNYNAKMPARNHVRDSLAPLALCTTDICAAARSFNQPLRSAVFNKQVIALAPGLTPDAVVASMESAFDPLVQKAIDLIRRLNTPFVTICSDKYSTLIELNPEKSWIGTENGVTQFMRSTDQHALYRTHVATLGLQLECVFDFEPLDETRAVRWLSGQFAKRFHALAEFEVVSDEHGTAEVGFMTQQDSLRVGDKKIPYSVHLSWNCNSLTVDLEYDCALDNAEGFQEISWAIAEHSTEINRDMRQALNRLSSISNVAHLVPAAPQSGVRETVVGVVSGTTAKNRKRSFPALACVKGAS